MKISKNTKIKLSISLNVIVVALLIYAGLNMAEATPMEIGIKRALIEAMN